MKYVVPAKRSSTRVPDKNFRPFANGRSLMDIMVEKYLRLDNADQIYVSSEDPWVEEFCDRHGVNYLPRPEHLTANSYPYQSVVNQVSRQLPDDDEVMWCHATDPFFDDHAAVKEMWADRIEGTDSVVVVYPMKDYLLDEKFNPLGFGFGPWHRPSQELPTFYLFGLTCSIMTRHVATSIGVVGAHPQWFLAGNQTIDIDTQDEFNLAARLYELEHR